VLRAIVVPVGRGLRATVTRATAAPAPEFCDARIVVRRGGSWRHKWADRDGFTTDETQLGTPLYVSGDDMVLETSRGNVFLVTSDGTLVTPPLGDGLLPGVTRRALLDLARDTGRAHEIRPVSRAELLESSAFWSSSVSLALSIRSVDGVELPRVDDLVATFRAQLIRGGAAVR
jgi:hypothetical protein